MTERRPENRHYILFNKPYGVLSQFTPEGSRQTLSSFGPFPPDVYPAGRLDAESEGLLFLTNDNSVKHFLTDPRFGHERTYLVQVERVPTSESIEQLRTGVVLGGRRTRPAEVSPLDGTPDLPPRPIPVRFRKSVPTSWLSITLREGRNHQIRKMTAAVGHPTLRLVRTHIGTFSLKALGVGSIRILGKREIDQLLAVAKAPPGNPPAGRRSSFGSRGNGGHFGGH